MAKKRDKRKNYSHYKNRARNNGWKNKKKYPVLTSRVKRRIVMVLMFVFAAIVSLSFFNLAGQGGKTIFKTLDFLIGKTVFFIPLALVVGGFLFFKPQKKRVFTPVLGALVLFSLGISGLLEGLNIEKAGGVIGYYVSMPFLKYFGSLSCSIFFSALIVISFLIFWEFAPKKSKEEKEKEKEKENIKKLNRKELEKQKEIKPIPAVIKTPEFEIKEISGLKKKKDDKGKIFEKDNKPKGAGISPELKGEYSSPSLDLLSSIKEKPTIGDTDYTSMTIKKTLADFGIPIEMSEVNVGPAVTRYALKPAEGVKLSKITGLVNNLSLALAAHPIRIEAPIPGKSLVGVEVPNKTRAAVSLKELLSQPNFQDSSSPLTVPLGRDVGGTGVFADLERMPHLLVAGSTGSGKTIFLQGLIVSLIFRNSPQILRLILVDPKRVEFPIYSSLPHLLTPVIYDAQKTVNALSWLITEMERRFEVLQTAGVRNIESFNKLASRNSKIKDDYGIMPYIVLIIDELADLMAARGREIEAAIVRLSQLARAVGIHLVVATQRPSVDVITGLIKANLTSRVAFQVASQVDSRTILDTAGAETLLGRGDMLFLSSDYGKPKRIQGCYAFQKEVKKVVDFISRENAPMGENGIAESLSEELSKGSLASGQEGMDFDDPLYEEAKQMVLQYKRASASLLQRRLKIGYARAARLLDMLEEQGVIGPADGARPRNVFIEKETDYH